jgi:hypothetical protein
MAIEAPPPPSSGRPELRASHEDREAAVDALAVAAGDGRLSPEELDERLEAALSAKTCAELAILTADLPQSGRPVQTAAKDLIRLDSGVAALRRDGSWVVPRRIEANVTSGSVRLDLTQAVITQPLLEVDVSVRMGDVTIITKPGIVVDTDEVSVGMGSVTVKAPRDSHTPVILRVVVTGHVDMGSFRARPARRAFWQWLFRRPLSQG